MYKIQKNGGSVSNTIIHLLLQFSFKHHTGGQESDKITIHPKATPPYDHLLLLRLLLLFVVLLLLLLLLLLQLSSYD